MKVLTGDEILKETFKSRIKVDTAYEYIYEQIFEAVSSGLREVRIDFDLIPFPNFNSQENQDKYISDLGQIFADMGYKVDITARAEIFEYIIITW